MGGSRKDTLPLLDKELESRGLLQGRGGERRRGVGQNHGSFFPGKETAPSRFIGLNTLESSRHTEKDQREREMMEEISEQRRGGRPGTWPSRAHVVYTQRETAQPQVIMLAGPVYCLKHYHAVSLSVVSPVVSVVAVVTVVDLAEEDSPNSLLFFFTVTEWRLRWGYSRSLSSLFSLSLSLPPIVNLCGIGTRP